MKYLHAQLHITLFNHIICNHLSIVLDVLRQKKAVKWFEYWAFTCNRVFRNWIHLIQNTHNTHLCVSAHPVIDQPGRPLLKARLLPLIPMTQMKTTLQWRPPTSASAPASRSNTPSFLPSFFWSRCSYFPFPYFHSIFSSILASFPIFFPRLLFMSLVFLHD